MVSSHERGGDATIDDQPAFAQVRARFLPRPVASTLVAITRLVPPNGLVEIDVMAVVLGA